MRRTVHRAEALGAATAELARESIEERFQAIDRDERVDQLLAELKAKKKAS